MVYLYLNFVIVLSLLNVCATDEGNRQSRIESSQWEAWMSWLPCSVTCGVGEQYRSRNCIKPPASAPRCQGSSIEIQPCNTHVVCPHLTLMAAHWEAWTSWSQCLVTCGEGAQFRSRMCTTTTGSTQRCQGNSIDTQKCDTNVLCQVNGNWGTWGTWSRCNCNTKTHSRSRECNNPIPALGGSNCVGVRYEQSSCADQCPATTPVPTTTVTTTPSTTTTEGPGVWTEWTEWSTCSTSCGSGARYIARFCIDPHTEKEKHDCIGPAVDSESCDVLQCAVDGSWSEWNEWSGCSRGLRFRSRVCNNSVPLFNGMNCKGSNVDFTNCTETTTATHGKLVPPEIFGQTEANVSENITLLCLTGISGLAVTWYYMESDHLPVGVSQPTGTNELIITGVDSKNYGKYTCVLSDSNNNTVKTQVFINLHESAPFIVSLIKVPHTVAEGTPVKLKCNVLAFPEPIIRWGYRDRSGNAYVPPPVTYKDGGKELDIDSFQSVLYGGIWTCKAINKLGTDQEDIVV